MSPPPRGSMAMKGYVLLFSSLLFSFLLFSSLFVKLCPSFFPLSFLFFHFVIVVECMDAVSSRSFFLSLSVSSNNTQESISFSPSLPPSLPPSLSPLLSLPQQGNYAAMKMGIAGLSATLAKEGARYDVKVRKALPSLPPSLPPCYRMTASVMPLISLNTFLTLIYPLPPSLPPSLSPSLPLLR